MTKVILEKEISSKVLMVGVFIGKNAPGGMASVVLSYKPFFEKFRYIVSWKDSNKLIKFLFALFAVVKLFFILLFFSEIKIVHFHTAEENSFWRKAFLMNIAYFFKKKVIMHMHAATFKDFYHDSKAEIKHKILLELRKVNRLIVLSNSWKEWFITIGVDPEKIIVINNMVSYPTLKEKQNDTKIHILFLGEIGDRKGIFDILRALHQNRSYFSSKIILKIGGNKNENKLKEMIENYKLSCFVHFEGWVSGDRKQELLNWADIYILPSFNEGLPIGILEAMSYNCAIISSPVGGIPDIIHHNKNGLLVTPGDIQEIYQALKLLIENKVILENLQLKNKNLIEMYYPKYVMEQLRELYSQLLGH